MLCNAHIDCQITTGAIIIHLFILNLKSTLRRGLKAKQVMYRAFNAVFGKVGRIASLDVVVQLVKTKCLRVLCYGIELCPANKSDIRSLQYVVDNCFCKIFDIKLKETAEECMREFNMSTVNDVIDARMRKFLAKYSVSENSLCQVFACVGNLW